MKLSDMNPDDFEVEKPSSQKSLKLSEMNPDDFKFEDDPGIIRSALSSLNQGLTMGYYDELRGLVKGGVKSIVNKTPFNEEYKTARDEARDLQRKAEKYNPRVSAHSQVAGALATSLIPGVNGVKGASALSNIGRGAAFGALDAVGQSDAENFSAEQAKAAGIGAGLGGGLVGVGEAVGPAVKKLGDVTKKAGKWGAEKLGIAKGAIDEYADNPKLYNDWAAEAEKNAPSTGNKLNDVLTSPQTRYVQDRVKSRIQPLYDDLAEKEAKMVAAKEARTAAKETYGEASDQFKRARSEDLQSLQSDLNAANLRLKDELAAAKELDPTVVDQVDNLFAKVKEKNQAAAAIQEKYLKGVDRIEVSKPLAKFENDIEKMMSSGDQNKLAGVLSDIKAKTDGMDGMNPSDARRARAYVQGLVDWDAVKREGYSDEATKSLQFLQKSLNDSIDDAIADPAYGVFRKQYADFMRTSESAREAIGKDYYTGIKSVMSNPDKKGKLQKLETLLGQTIKEPFSVIEDPRVRDYMKAKYMPETDKAARFQGLPERQAYDTAKNADVKSQLKGLPERQALSEADMAAAEAKGAFTSAKRNIGPVTEKNADAMIDRYSRMTGTAKNAGAKDAFSGLGEDVVDDMNKYTVNRAFTGGRPNGSRLVNLMTNLVPAPFKPAASLAGAAMDYSGGAIAKGAIDVGDMLQKAGPRFGNILQKAFETGGNKSLAITHTILMKNYPEYADLMSK